MFSICLEPQLLALAEMVSLRSKMFNGRRGLEHPGKDSL